jgi:hypothetical protein
MKSLREFQVFADCHQFYLMDAGISPMIPDTVTDQDILRRLRTAPHIVVFHTESASQVPVKIAFVSEPIEVDGVWDHQSDFNLSLPSGTAVLCGCMDYVPECPRLAAAPSTYDGRAYFAGASVGEERYLLMLWPSTAQPVTPGDTATSGAPRS